MTLRKVQRSRIFSSQFLPCYRDVKNNLRFSLITTSSAPLFDALCAKLCQVTLRTTPEKRQAASTPLKSRLLLFGTNSLKISASHQNLILVGGFPSNQQQRIVLSRLAAARQEINFVRHAFTLGSTGDLHYRLLCWSFCRVNVCEAKYTLDGACWRGSLELVWVDFQLWVCRSMAAF